VSCNQQRLQRFGVELIEIGKSSNNHERVCHESMWKACTKGA
jgi:hypothetical protein